MTGQCGFLNMRFPPLAQGGLGIRGAWRWLERIRLDRIRSGCSAWRMFFWKPVPTFPKHALQTYSGANGKIAATPYADQEDQDARVQYREGAGVESQEARGKNPDGARRRRRPERRL